jgi:3-oxoacyl-[acyl-carrier-protein] synthase II
MGYGNSFSPTGYKKNKYEGIGLRNAISIALKEASLKPEDIDYICSSANSTKELDRMETEVIKSVFGEYANKIPVSSIKSMVGESFSASGALALTAAIGAIQRGFIPPTINYKERDNLCDLDYVPNEPRQRDINTVLVTSADPYGQNTAVVIGRYDT